MNGANLAVRQDVVVVGINHRLGLLAHLDLSPWSDDHHLSGNAGILDQALALQWVREHAASLGGDPTRVTLFGQSGGGMKATTMYGVPAAAGSFHRVVSQSGGDWVYFDPSEAGELAARCFHLLEVPEGRIDVLSDMPLERLLEVQAYMESVPSFDTASGTVRSRFRPIVDGNVLAVRPVEALRRGLGSSIPLLIGTTRDEATTLYFRDLRSGAVDPKELVRRLGPLGSLAETVVEGYRSRRPGATAADLLIAIQSDLLFRRNAVMLADAQEQGGGAAYVFRFDWSTPVLGGIMGAAHCLEIPFVFDVVDDVPAAAAGGDAAHRLAHAVSGAWATFARDGAPWSTALPRWPRWGDHGEAMLLDLPSTVAPAPWRDDHELLSSINAEDSWNAAAVGRSEPPRAGPTDG